MTNYYLFLCKKWRKWKIAISEERARQKQLLSIWQGTVSRRGNPDRSAWARKRKNKRHISARGWRDNWRITIWRIPQDPLILRDRYLNNLLYRWYLYSTVIRRGSIFSMGEQLLFLWNSSWYLKFDHRLSLKIDSL